MTEEEFLSIACQKYQQLSALQSEKSFYEYEKRFDALWVDLGKEVLEKNIPDQVKGRKKKIASRYGEIHISNTHLWSQTKDGFQVGSYLKELQLHAGQEDNLNLAAQRLGKYLRIDSSSSQIGRACQYYGQILGSEGQDMEQQVCRSLKGQCSELGEEQQVYTMIDGSMLLTRQDSGWKEVKLSRSFTSQAHLQINEGRHWIKESTYVAHLGKHDGFLQKLQPICDIYDELGDRHVFINDGARWIWNWVETYYPNSCQILDFYAAASHAVEYLHEFARVRFKDRIEMEQWVNHQRQCLLNDQVVQVIQAVRDLVCRSQKQKEAQERLLNYYINNQKRMYYKTFKDRGLLVGSGPIESAHRMVIQKRMKQSGQRWTQQGAQQVVNLRIANLNNQWRRVIELVDLAA